MIAALAFVYAVLFWAISWKKPQFALMMILASTSFQNDISGGVGVKFSFAEINLLLTIPLFLARHKRISLGPLSGPITVYFIICLFTSVVTWRGNTAMTSLLQMFLFMVVVVMVFSSLADKPEDVTLALYGLLATSCFLALYLIVFRTNYILGLHKNGVGGSLSCAILVNLELWFAANAQTGSAALRRKLILTVTLLIISAGLLLTLSRGAWLGALGGTFLIIMMRRQYALAARSVLIMIPVMAVLWMSLPQDSREYAVDFKQGRNITQRYKNIDFAAAKFEESPLYGLGVGLRKQYDSTNLVWGALAETGVLGTIALASIFASFFWMIWQLQRKVDHKSFLFSMLAIGGGLMLDRLMHGMVDHYWARGPTMTAWATAGMALGVFFARPQHARVLAGNATTPLAALTGDRRRLRRLLVALHLLEDQRRREVGEA